MKATTKSPALADGVKHNNGIDTFRRVSTPPFLAELLRNRPAAGAGIHSWLFKVARQLHAHMPAGEIVALLERETANCGRSVPRREIVGAVQNALACAWQPSGRTGATPTASRWPEPNRERIEAVIASGYGLADLWESSPVRFDDAQPRTEDIIDALFPAGALLCCGKSNSDFATKPREGWRGSMQSLALIVPSPMSALTGLTKDGKESAHTLANTGPRRFQVCEFDSGSTDHHAAILSHLGQYAPLVLAVHSGGKSLHGWFFVANWTEDKQEKFFKYAVTLGADRATWTRSQFVRMPDGLRDNGKRQVAYYFNPQTVEGK